jgi:hypothetical protein
MVWDMSVSVFKFDFDRFGLDYRGMGERPELHCAPGCWAHERSVVCRPRPCSITGGRHVHGLRWDCCVITDCCGIGWIAL